jgi:heme-degrading monooxygenase HmoA
VTDIVKINAIRVPEGMGQIIEERFASRAGAMDEVEGFLSFELLRPTAGEDRYFVYTRWETEEAFQAWRESQRFAESHAGQTGKPPEGHGAGKGPGEGSGPVAMGADLLEFEVALAVHKV